MTKTISPARWAAYQVLMGVENEHGFASSLLHSPLAGALDERDAALAEELTLGVLRWQGQLDAVIGRAGGRPPEKLDPEVRLALRLGVYQLLRLDRVPQRAAVSESVEIVKRARKTSAAGLVNAVLRKAAELVRSDQVGSSQVRSSEVGSNQARSDSAPLAGQPLAEQAVPLWLLDRWRRNFGASQAEKLALQTLETPKTWLRLNARFDPGETVRLLEAEGVKTRPAELPLCRRVEAGRPARSQCFRQGRIRIQDIGSQRVALLLGLEWGHRFLDLCAAPGGKTFQALEWRGRAWRGSAWAREVAERGPAAASVAPVSSVAASVTEGLAVACDSSFDRLVTMRRLATIPVAMVVLDAGRPLPFSGRFDRILVDAPCSGTGTLARNPEIKWKLTPADIEDLAARQRAILTHALEMLAPRGRLVYSTCSLEPEENEIVVDAVITAAYQRVETHLWPPGEHEGDGFFACVIERR